MGSSEDVKENTGLLLLLLFRGIAIGSRTHTRQLASCRRRHTSSIITRGYVLPQISSIFSLELAQNSKRT